MQIEIQSVYQQQLTSRQEQEIQTVVEQSEDQSFFQSPEFFDLVNNQTGMRPVQLLAYQGSKLVGTLLGVIQYNGKGIKSWLSRRMIIWGGPQIPNHTYRTDVAYALLSHLKTFAQGKSIFIEFRNMSDMRSLSSVFEQNGFNYKPHLNYLVQTDTEQLVKKRMSSSRLRQVKSSLKKGATIEIADSEQELLDFYHILSDLYKNKVKKPLPDLSLFLRFWQSKHCKLFVVKVEGVIKGGILCPIYKDTIYEWYICGLDGETKGIHPSVLATWAPIEWAIENNYKCFDFMGAGKPDDGYGVRTFKERFGGDQVSFGRYEYIVNSALFSAGKLGLKLYQKIT